MWGNAALCWSAGGLTGALNRGIDLRSVWSPQWSWSVWAPRSIWSPRSVWSPWTMQLEQFSTFSSASLGGFSVFFFLLLLMNKNCPSLSCRKIWHSDLFPQSGASRGSDDVWHSSVQDQHQGVQWVHQGVHWNGGIGDYSLQGAWFGSLSLVFCVDWRTPAWQCQN